VRPVEPGAGQQPDHAPVEPGMHAVAVEFDFMEPVRPLRRLVEAVRNENAFSGVRYRPSSEVIIMILKTSIGLAFAAACLSAIVTMPVRADTARQNVIQSERYDRLLETNRAFRQARMRKECGPITDPQLHQQCLASFSQDEPMVASAASHRRVASSRHHAKQYVGSSAGPRHYQSHLGK
jgi:hypothetical protein